MKQMRIAIIGQGRSGRDIHGAFLLNDKSERYKVVAVCDWKADRRERAAKDFGCDVYEDYRELFKRDDIDLVVNSTFSYEHCPVTLDLLSHGFNVLVEKPFAMTEADCKKMIDTAYENNVKLFVFQQSRFAPYYTKIREIVDSGVLGKIEQISISFSGFARRWDWQCSQRFGGGGLYNTGPHPLDQALDLLDFDPQTTLLYSRLDTLNTYGDADDYAKLLITAPGKPLIDLEVSSANGYFKDNYVIHAKNGSLRATLREIQYKYFVPLENVDHTLILEPLCHENGYPAYCSEKLNWHEETISLDGSAFDVGTSRYYDMVYRCLFEGRRPEIEPWQSMMQIQISEQVHRDNPLTIKY
ncbi:MAG: Gfo/Idh/MocA family oxidoreductase [Clostridia bacterium]|nr:Gfo/Idh/MocA family oxidoreductase [Clostridia bacterium]